jgi:precorrin-2 dehydrogenase/sirohydrochlorin ferrochelatase
LIVDLKMQGKAVVVLGGGRETEAKALAYARHGAAVTVVNAAFAEGLREAAREGTVRLVEGDWKRDPTVLDRLAADPLLVVVTEQDDAAVEGAAAFAARRHALLYAVDSPGRSDIVQPALADADPVHVAVSTEGKSPAMAGVLARRLAGQVTKEERGMVRLQGFARKLAKACIPDPERRRDIMHEILRDDAILGLLRKGKEAEARGLVEARVEKAAGTGTG